MPQYTTGFCLTIAALYKSKSFRALVNRQLGTVWHTPCCAHCDLVEPARRINQSAKKHFRQDLAFLFSHWPNTIKVELIERLTRSKAKQFYKEQKNVSKG
jgi:hypothetical protein